MKTIKPLRLAIMTRTFEDGPRSHLVVSAMTLFPFQAPQHLLPEVSLWKLVGKELGGEGVLDEAMPKTNGEALVVGRAYPKGGAAPQTHVRLSVGPITKTLYVFGPRRFRLGVASAPEPFTEMPLRWENAFGGAGYAKNPVGKGYKSVKTDAGETHPLPNVEDPKHMVKSPGDRPDPAGLWAYDLTWAQRQAHVGTYDDRWLKKRYPGYPEDFHWDFFNVAPPDQRLSGFFAGNESFKLENMHPSKPVLEGALPGLVARCFVNLDRPGGPVLREVVTKVDTVIFFPHEERGVVIHRGVTEVEEDDAHDVLQLVAGVERADEPKPAEHYARVLADRLDRGKPFAFVRDSELLPRPAEGAPPPGMNDEKLSDMEDLLAMEGFMQENARRGAMRRLDEARAELLSHGMDASGIPRELPPPEPVPSLDDMPAVFEKLEQEAKRHQKEAEAQRLVADAEVRRVCNASGVDYDKMLADAAARGGKRPARFTARAEIARLADMKRLADNAGAVIPGLDQKLADPALTRKLIAVEEHMFDVLRRFAHHMPPPEDQVVSVREEIEQGARGRARGEDAESAVEVRSFAGRDLTDADLSGLDLAGFDFEEAILERADLTGADLTGANLTHAILTRAKLAGAKLTRAKLRGANLGLTDLSKADLAGADLREAALGKANLRGASFEDADLTGADLLEAVLEDVSFAGAKAPEAKFLKATLRRVSMARAALSKACFVEGSMEDVDFSGADLRAAIFLTVHGEGVRFTQADLSNVRFVNGAAFPGAQMAGARAPGSNFRDARFPGADLTGAVLNGSDLSGCDFSDAKMRGVSARDALLIRTDLRRADMEGADLMQALLQKAHVEGTHLKNASLFRADSAKMRGDKATDLSGANVKHVRVVPDRRRDG